MLGELLLPPVRLRQLTWDELDSLYAGQDVRRQKDLVGFRMVAAQAYNLAVEAKDRLAESAYLPLPSIDRPAPVAATPERASWQARMKERFGDLLEA